MVLLPGAKAELADWVQHHRAEWTVHPVKRVYIPKGNGKRRPTRHSRCRGPALQALVRAALEPEWEARFEPKSYGFRPGRGCHDAIGAIYSTLNGHNPSRVWVLDADLTAAFDRVAHHHLLTALGGFPAGDSSSSG